MRTVLARPLSISLSNFSAARREPTRLPEDRGADFDAQFDSETLFYDAFFGPDGRILLVGPPFLNLGPALQAMSLTARPSGRVCTFELREMDRVAEILVDAPEGTSHLTLAAPFGTTDIPIGPTQADLFAGRRVMFTLSKNNPLTWVQDWIRFGRDIHGADAVLFYDNGSTRYGPEDIAAAIAELDGIEMAGVVSWPFKYGPQGPDATRFWDSDFCQHGFLEAARFRFLAAAASAQSSDIDELVLSPDRRSIFEAAERSPFGIVRYNGRWIAGISARPVERERRHRNYTMVEREHPARRWTRWIPFDLPKWIPVEQPKWTVVPRRTPRHAQWRIHTIGRRWLPSRLISTNSFIYRHFREITTNWKYDRVGVDGFDPARHEEDVLLEEHFTRVRWDR